MYDVIVENDTKTTFCKYEGGFSEGNFSGYGRYYIYKNGEELVEYEGTFLKNEKCGQGIFYWYDDNNSVNKKYDEAFAYDKPFGYGVYEKYEENYKYEGTLVNGKYDGRGVLWKNGEIEYIGGWQEGRYNGYGTKFFYDSNGERRYYTGEFLDGYMHGNGKIYNMSNEIIEIGPYEMGLKINENIE